MSSVDVDSSCDVVVVGSVVISSALSSVWSNTVVGSSRIVVVLSVVVVSATKNKVF